MTPRVPIRMLTAVFAIVAVGITCSCSRQAAHRPAERRAPQGKRQAVRPATTATDAVDGESILGRPIIETEFGKGPRRVLYVGGVHGSEYGTDVARRFVAFLESHPESIPDDVHIDVVECANPDGYAADTKGNGRHVDINRNFPTSGWRRAIMHGRSSGKAPASEPETRLLLKELREKPDVVVSLHSQGGIIDPDGTFSWPVARRMAARTGWSVVNVGDDGAIRGSLGHYVAERMKTPMVTVELQSPKLTPPVTEALLEAARTGPVKSK